MKIKKGTKLLIKDKRKGTFLAIASEDFDTDDQWYSVILDQDYLEGMANDWIRGENVPARKGLSEVEVRSEEYDKGCEIKT